MEVVACTVAGLGVIVLRSVPCRSPWVRPKCNLMHEQRAGARRRSLVSGSAPWMDWWPLTALEQGGACEGTLAPPAHAPGVHKGPALPGSALGASTIAAQKEGSCSRGADIPVRTGSLHKCTSHLEGEGAMGQSRGRGSGGLGSRATSKGAGGHFRQWDRCGAKS